MLPSYEVHYCWRKFTSSLSLSLCILNVSIQTITVYLNTPSVVSNKDLFYHSTHCIITLSIISLVLIHCPLHMYSPLFFLLFTTGTVKKKELWALTVFCIIFMEQYIRFLFFKFLFTHNGGFAFICRCEHLRCIHLTIMYDLWQIILPPWISKLS